MKCERCGQETRMQVQAVLAAPSELLHKFSKSNLRRADVYLMGVLWETADFICTNFECRTVTDGYGNYVSRLKKDRDALRKYVESDADEACEYGDNCPSGAVLKHGRCRSCRAKLALATMEGS